MCEVHSLIWDNLLPTYKTNFYTHVHTEQKATEAQGHYSHSGDVFSRKGICGVTDQQAGLPYSSAEVRGTSIKKCTAGSTEAVKLTLPPPKKEVR